MPPLLNKLRVRILLLVLLAIVPALALILDSAHQRRRQDTSAILENAHRLSRFVAGNLERDLETIREFLQTLAHVPEMVSADADQCIEFSESLQRDIKLYRNIGRVMPDGTVVCSAIASMRGANISDQSWFRQTVESGGFIAGGFPAKDETGRAPLNFGYAVVDPATSAVTSVLIAAHDFQWLSRLGEQAGLPQGATLTAMDRTGTILARFPKPELYVGRQFPEAPIVQTILQSGEGQVERAGLDGVSRLYAFTSIPHHGISVHVGFPTRLAFRDANRALWRNLGLMALATLLALAAAWYVGELFLVRQVNTLVRMAHQLGEGNLTTRANLPYDGGELGILARAFDEMAESLEFREAQLRESESERSSTESRYTEIIDNAPEAIIGADENGALFLFNRRAALLLGYAPREIQNEPYKTIFDDESVNRMEMKWKEAKRVFESTGSAHRLQLTARHKDGKLIPVDASISRFQRGGREGFTAILRLRSSGPVRSSDDKGERP